jgi:hypothetical protein
MEWVSRSMSTRVRPFSDEASDRKRTSVMNGSTFPGIRLNNLEFLPVSTESHQGFRFLPLGFLLELGFLLILAATVPSWVPTLMRLIWPETAKL